MTIFRNQTVALKSCKRIPAIIPSLAFYDCKSDEWNRILNFYSNKQLNSLTIVGCSLNDIDLSHPHDIFNFHEFRNNIRRLTLSKLMLI